MYKSIYKCGQRPKTSDFLKFYTQFDATVSPAPAPPPPDRTQLTVYTPTVGNVSIILWCKDISFGGNETFRHQKGCCIWLECKCGRWFCLFSMEWTSTGTHTHIHTLERMSNTFLPYPRTHRLMKRNGCGIGIAAYHLNELIIYFCVLAAAAAPLHYWPRPKS